MAINAADLELILTNLLHNAVKYGGENTKIKISGGWVGRKAFIDVTSYGICIRAAERERIFESGYRTAEAAKVEFVAAGIGLFSARRAAQRWGGYLTLKAPQADEDIMMGNHFRNTFRLVLPC